MSEFPQNIVAKPRLLFRPHAVLGWSLTPGYGVRVGFRPEIVQNIGADGWRLVPGAAESQGPRLAVYGCSFTYGTGLADDETFVALLQRDLPAGQLLNRGIGGQSTVQNFLQFRRDIASGQIDAAIFAIMSDHRFRNIAHPKRMRQLLNMDWYRLGVEHVPVLRQGRDGQNTICYVPIWQPALQQGGFDVFLPDDHMIDSATLAILAETQNLAKAHKIPIQFALLDQLDLGFNSAVQTRFDSTIDISVPLDSDHSFLPHDPHPNQVANRAFSDRLVKAASNLIGRVEGRVHDQS
ncbi:MAG: hypothetical protein WBB25_17505 [Sulfitobacter sp.]